MLNEAKRVREREREKEREGGGGKEGGRKGGREGGKEGEYFTQVFYTKLVSPCVPQTIFHSLQCLL